MGSLSLSLKVVLISTSVLFLSSYLKVFVTLVHGFYVNQAALLWSSLVSWLKPPYLYVIINCIIITIVASSRFDHNHDTNSTTTHDHIEKIPMDDYVHGMKISTVKTRFDGALKSRALIVYQDREEEEVFEDKCMVLEDRENGVAGDFVISKSTWVPPVKRNDSSENNLLLLENLSPAGKPLVSSRFGHGKVVKARPEGTIYPPFFLSSLFFLFLVFILRPDLTTLTIPFFMSKKLIGRRQPGFFPAPFSHLFFCAKLKFEFYACTPSFLLFQLLIDLIFLQDKKNKVQNGI